MKKLPLVLATSLLSLTAAVAQNSPSASRPKVSTTTAVQRDLDVFSDWVNDKIDRAAADIRREKPRLNAEFERQSKRIDRAVDSLTVEGKREYETQKVRYKNWSTKQDSLDRVARRPETSAQAQRRLLGEEVVISRARATELPDLYFRLVETMRDKRKNWTSADWSAASAVLSNLNARYEQVRTDLPIEERLRIRTLQGEFRTLEKARNVKDAINEQ
ncbi:hypothetical protein HMJ29_12320 [Hymenobacter taeanensis]|uniref:Uncharacterized protein n=1 Tax=Hymenobacter taeanensis TaxID=2735321 RepID=A0A6M6BI73_9BACT|nr:MULTISPECIES: hypothetical protein [Hymenobacter]QJX47682.1 hypothetical protein HMJ29_12320 [Hymenobacter taeanensis]UOQ82834.1 hypothetical protein MUN83_08755 [Hymenobacter sp. 5414T-23]